MLQDRILNLIPSRMAKEAAPPTPTPVAMPLIMVAPSAPQPGITDEGLSALTPDRYWRLFTDPGLTPPGSRVAAFQELGLTDQDLTPLTSTLTGLTGDSIAPLGMTTLSLTISEEPRTKTLMVVFIVVDLPSAYNAIIGRPTLNRLRAMVSTRPEATPGSLDDAT
ncbi:hypothetical protein B296_00040033 [Ensete ventricosum]|uniref:Uncharacterized protein n=1 Tax=Ensete ventricosum TaxID=4639 RepID=A0A426YHR4_ENSVE|nr:hypothetical protein B296_00040033 [Ensete ventricosum]